MYYGFARPSVHRGPTDDASADGDLHWAAPPWSVRSASIALLAVLILATVWWFVARRSYSTPSAYGSAGEQAGIAENIVRRGVLTALSAADGRM